MSALSNLNVEINHLVKMQTDSVGLRRGLRFYISSKCIGAADAADLVMWL